MRIGYFGGSFDPVHAGHVALAREVREQVGLDRMRFLIARRPPHKPERELTADRHRLAMLELAIRDEDAFEVDARELTREGPSYTVASMEEVHAEEPSAELFFLIGADNLAGLPGWRRFEDLARLVTFLVVARPGLPEPDRDVLEALGAQRVDAKRYGVSSTDIRRRARAGESLAGLTPEPVIRYIAERGLYASAET